MIVIVSDAAERDLEQIADYIAARNPLRAVSFVQELRRKCLSLAEMPEAFPLVLRYENAAIRRRIYGEYLIFYRVSTEVIEIIHVLNGAMNYEPLLFPDGS